MVVQITDSELKQTIASGILRSLPEWFGIPEATHNYVEGCIGLPFWADATDGEYLGFITLKETGKYTAEIYVMGVLPTYHRKGIGRRLFTVLYGYCREHGYEFLQVKTVDGGHYVEYDRTRQFYEHPGFKKFEVFPTLWDAWNPCLVMVMGVR